LICLIYRTANERSPVTFAIAAEETEDVHISECPVFVISGAYSSISAKNMWNEVKQVRDLLSNLIQYFVEIFYSTLYFPSCCRLIDKLIIVL